MCYAVFLLGVFGCSTDSRIQKSLFVSKEFVGNPFDKGIAVRETPDGGYIVGGSTNLDSNPGYFNYLIMRFYSNLTLDWALYMGDEDCDNFAYSLEITDDGGFVCAGVYGSGYLVVSKFLSNGTFEWAYVIDYAYKDDIKGRENTLLQTVDGGYIVAGCLRSDSMLLKLFPNGTLEWTSTMGTTGFGYSGSVEILPDGGFILVSDSKCSNGDGMENDDILVSKFFSNGSLEQCVALGGIDKEVATAIRLTSDGGLKK